MKGWAFRFPFSHSRDGATHSTVIPAKAGIQGHGKQRLRPWIPAFAGMTIVFCKGPAKAGIQFPRA